MGDPQGTLRADEGLCVGCRICERTCAYAAIRIEGPLGSAPANHLPARVPSPVEGDAGEVQAGYSSLDEARLEAGRCLECPDPSCVWGCPAHNDIPGFISRVKAGDLPAAQRVLAATSCMPGVCARVCDAGTQCEGACALSLAGGDPVSIRLLERFVADAAPLAGHGYVSMASQGGARVRDRSAAHGTSVAVVGGGPAGISAALWLLAGGAEVELFEAGAEIGGVLRWGIPRYTLEREVWSPLVNALEAAAGLHVHTSTEVGRDVDLGELARRHDAVVLAHGASVPPGLELPGAPPSAIMDARQFLEGARGIWDPHGAISGSELASVPVLVVGGGDTAMAVSRTARRLGARVVSIRRRVRSKAQVRTDELDQAVSEGVDVRFGLALERIERAGGAATGRDRAGRDRACQDTPAPALSAVLRSAAPWWRVPVVWLSGEPGARRERLAVGMVVAATGFKVDGSVVSGYLPAYPADPIMMPEHGGVMRDLLAASGLDPAAGGAGSHRLARAVLERHAALDASAREGAGGLWIAGDALRGPASVVEAMAQGRAAALGILGSIIQVPVPAAQLPEV